MKKYVILREQYSGYYAITNTKALCEVVEQINDNNMRVKVMGTADYTNRSNLYDIYAVDPSYFEDITLEEYAAKYPDAVCATEIELLKVPKAKVELPEACPYSISEMNDLLDHYDYDSHLRGASYNGTEKIAQTCWENKAKLRELLRKHPNWDEEQQAIIFQSTIETGINANGVQKFGDFIKAQFHEKFVKEHNVEKILEYDCLFAEYERAIEAIRTARSTYELTENKILNHITVNYMTLRELEAKKTELLQKMKGYSLVWYTNCETGESQRGAITDEEKRYLDDVCCFFGDLQFLITSSSMTEELVAKVNELFPDVKVVVGQKTSRVINKICKLLGLDGIKKIETRYNGEQKDFGYNYHFALLGDSINPITITKYTVISINLFDYWTASMGTNWSSCHSIDIFHVDEGHENYNGCYSSGTESYMLDGSSVVMYTVDKNYEGKMYKALKDRRMMAHISKDGSTFVFGRLYPDGRDGGEAGMAAQFRQILQKVLSECTGNSNYWTVKKGTSNNRDIVENDSNATNYCDYYNYSDTGYCVVKGMEPVKIKIGHAPICPCCGNEHVRNNNIFCYDCMSSDGENEDNDSYIASCCRCGDSIYEGNDEYIYCEDNDSYYCCSDCAERDGLIYCDDDYNYHTEDNCFYDDYATCYYSGEPEVTTENGNHYCSEENAEADGYFCWTDGCWYNKGTEGAEDYFSGETIYIKDDDVIEIMVDGMNHFTICKDEAEAEGFEENEDGVWVKADREEAV